MVTHPRTPSRPGAIRPLNPLRPVRVSADAAGTPQKVYLPRALKVMRVEDQWNINDEWWREKGISRRYFVCLLHDGSKLTLVYDGPSKKWYTQKG